MIREEDLAGVEFFDKLPKKGKETLIKTAVRATYRKKERLAMGATFFWVRRGNVNAFCTGENGDEVFVYAVQKDCGCVVNENLTYVFGANAEILYWTALSVESARAYAPFAAYLGDVAKRQETAAVEQFASVMFSSLDERLSTFLIASSGKSRTHAVLLTQEEIAKYVGTSREVVTRKLKAWEEEGAVACARGKVSILNKDALRKKQ